MFILDRNQFTVHIEDCRMFATASKERKGLHQSLYGNMLLTS